MGRIGRLIKTEIEKFIVQTVESYFGANTTAETFAPAGDDSPPLPEDRIILVQVDGIGNFVAAGVLSVSQGAKPGERIMYSRDKNGDVKAAIKLLNDGKIELASPSDVSLNADGEFSAKGDGVTVEGRSSLTLKSPSTELTGGTVRCKGTAVPDGTGCFCGVPYCLYSGAPQTGTNVKNS